MSPDFQAMPRHVPLLSLTGSSLASTGTPKRYLSSPPEPLIGDPKSQEAPRARRSTTHHGKPRSTVPATWTSRVPLGRRSNMSTRALVSDIFTPSIAYMSGTGAASPTHKCAQTTTTASIDMKNMAVSEGIYIKRNV